MPSSARTQFFAVVFSFKVRVDVDRGLVLYESPCARHIDATGNIEVQQSNVKAERP